LLQQRHHEYPFALELAGRCRGHRSYNRPSTMMAPARRWSE